MMGRRHSQTAFRGLLKVGRWFAAAALVAGGFMGCADVDSGEGENVGTVSEALTLAQIWGFESASAWTITAGSATKQASSVHDEGSFSLQLTAPGFVAVRGDAVAKPSAVSPLMAVDVMIPTQAGPYYLGAVQMVVSVPSLNINSQWVNQRELSVPTGVWQTLTFELPSNIYSQLLSSSFSDLQITLGLNSPSGLNQPFRFDNLRFLPSPTCVGKPNGTLCDDLTVCTTGSSCNGQVCGSVTSVPPGSACDVSDDVLGFENFPAWQVTNGSAALAPNTTHVQGVRSLQINTPNFMTVTSVPLATLHKVSQTLSLRVQKPTNQPNPSWHGDVTVAMTSPTLGINFTSTKQLTGQPNGSFFELTFAVPTATYQALANNSYSDLKFAVSVNPPNGQSGFYLLDDLHFVPVTSCSGVLNNTACDDASLCTEGDRCTGGICGATVNCNDGNVCTDDGCVAATGCFHNPNTVSCEDGNACTAGDRCASGACRPGAPVICGDGNVCTDDSCNPATGCVYTANTAACDDANSCTAGDHCSAGACVPGAPTAGSCSDGNVCTGVLSDGTDACNAGVCSGPPISCDDGSNCTDDVCNNPGGCAHNFKCGSGVCFMNNCCTPATCLSAHAECGTVSDTCGGTVSCSAICPPGGSCSPGGRCLPPPNFNDKSGVNICEVLLSDLIIPAVTHEDSTCLDFDFWECAFGVGVGHPDCCIPGACFFDPVCYVTNTVVDVAEKVYHEGEVYCDFRSPEEYLEKLLNGSISSTEHFVTMWETGGLSELFDYDIALLTNAGHHVPANVNHLVRKLTETHYDESSGFSYDDLDDVMIVSSDFPTAGMYLPGSGRLAITMGPVVIMESRFYDALFNAHPAITYEQFVADTSVCNLFLASVQMLMHELVHVRQYRELGRYNFTTQYLASALVNGYGGIGFEHEAFNYAITIDEIQGGHFCGVLAHSDNRDISNNGLSVAPNTCPQLTPLDVIDFPSPCP